MNRPDLAGLPPVAVPPGYEFRTYRPGDEAAWGAIMNTGIGSDWTVEQVREHVQVDGPIELVALGGDIRLAAGQLLRDKAAVLGKQSPTLLVQQIVAGQAAKAEIARYNDAWRRFLAGEWTPEMEHYLYPDREQALQLVPVSREIAARLDRYVAFLLDWQQRLKPATDMFAAHGIPGLKHAMDLMEKILAKCLENEIATDAVVASNLQQARKFWDMREHIPLAQADDGPNIKHDVSLPISAIPKFA